jgi:uncharacterized protein (DUF433 family)
VRREQTARLSLFRSFSKFTCVTWHRQADDVEASMPLPDPLITISPDFLSGTPVFTGTRVPVQAMFDYLEGGRLEEFLDGFPSVRRVSTRSPLQSWPRKASLRRPAGLLREDAHLA